MRLVALLLCLIAVSAPQASAAQGAAARNADSPLSAALIQDFVGVTSGFSGASITLFGATRTNAADRGDIVVVVRGPNRAASVARRFRILGLWLGRESLRFDTAPGYFAVASARPLSEIASDRTLTAAGILPDPLVRAAAAEPDHPELDAFVAAFVRLKQRERLYLADPGAVRRLQGGLFRIDLSLPDRTPPGLYTVRVVLFRDGRPTATVTNTLLISRQGLEREIDRFADQLPWLYGLAAVFLALFAGWAAWAGARRLGPL
jgi:uncharacterized protein (TIGR02186 family)